MPTITISYRRDDSEAITGRIYDRLVSHYGREAVFRDVDSIPPGVDFRKHIHGILQNTDIMLVIIGRRWMGSSRAGNARINDEDDPVRIEVESAIQQGMDVIPVLVSRAKMPAVSRLPQTLKDFPALNAVRVDSGQDFDFHTDRLLQALDRKLQARGKPLPASKSPGPAPDSVTSPNGQASAGRAVPMGSSLGVTASADAGAVARPEWGGYLKSSVAELMGSYLVLLPSFKTPGSVVAFSTEITWDGNRGGLVFQERNRISSRRMHSGHVQIPRLSTHVYLVAGANGWLRSVTLSVTSEFQEMRGVLSTLQHVAGTMYVPLATPIVYLKRATFDQDRFGEIKPGDAHYPAYVAKLRQTIDTFVSVGGFLGAASGAANTVE